MTESLEALRARIDALDRRLVEMLNERAQVVVDIGKLKRAGGGPIYAPHREAEVLSRALENNTGPLPNRTIEGVFRELMSGSFQLEKPLSIGYLGPPGSFSHVAARAQFGSSVDFDAVDDIPTVFIEVARGQMDYGIVPIENSTGGGVADTLDAFFANRNKLSIYAEAQVTIRHNLLANCTPKEVRQIISKPQVFAQCKRWLDAHYPHAEKVIASSSSRAVLIAKDASPSNGVAAIASTLAGTLYELNPLFSDIEDNPNNITRFLVLARQKAQPSGEDKTSMMFKTKDEPGALVRVLHAFESAGVNLTHIDKRPSQRENWTYTFFIDAQGHRDEPALAQAIIEATGLCQEFSVLGSYPRSQRIL